MSGATSAKRSPIVSRNRVIDVIRPLLRTATVVERRFTVEQVSDLSGVEVRAIRTYMANDETEVRAPPLSAALSIAVVLGRPAVNSVLALIGYSASPLEDEDPLQPMQLAANAMGSLAIIARAAADNRIDHTEELDCQAAADAIIATVLPLSSAGKAA